MGSGAGAALVTGAANGIGRAIALRLRADGFAVAAADIEARDARGPEELKSADEARTVPSADGSATATTAARDPGAGDPGANGPDASGPDTGQPSGTGQP